jgi:hypothetical protein
MTTAIHRFLAVIKLPLPVVALIKFTQALIAAMTGNAFFPTPNPPIPVVAKALALLDTTETATKTRAKGTVAARNAARLALVSDLHAWKAYVQQVADANPEQAAAIIASAGMTVRKATARTKLPFAAKFGPTSGTVHLTAKSAAVRASYDWAWSADGGKTWTEVSPTLQAKTTITGLPVATNCFFRYRPVTKAGAGDWSLPTALIVK